MRPLLFWFLALIHLSCGGDSSSAGQSLSLNLARHPELVSELKLPKSIRPRGRNAPKKWSFQKAFTERNRSDGRVEYLVVPPFRAVFYAQESGRRPPDLQVFDSEGKKVPFRKQSKGKVGPVNTWGWVDEKVVLRLPEDASPPEPSAYKVRFPLARELEQSLNLKSSGLSQKAFALRTLPLRRSYEHGIYLPAPGSIAYDLTVPNNGQLKLTALLMVPAIQTGSKSDGARLVVEAEAKGRTQELFASNLKVGAGIPVSIDLSEYAGQDIRLRMRTESGKTKMLDYVFLKEPVVYTPKKAPQRVVLAFVDTLRQDHVGAYGHDRDTTPTMDRLAKNGVVFTNARSPSPWTRPSALGALYGVAPEDVTGLAHIGERLAEAGYATAAFVSNTWVTGRDDLGIGWTSHRALLAAPAARQVKAAASFMAAHADRDALVMVHFIDPHLPYLESKQYKTLWAGEAPKGLGGRLDQAAARKAYGAAQTDEERAAIRTYMLARYDQNIRAVDDALKRLVKAAGPDALVVVFSDHGEEFWERGGFEHGHTLYDELMKVPLIIKSPKLTPREVDAPVSLLDIVPTVLDLVGEGVPTDAVLDPTVGWSLAAASMGNAAAIDQLVARPIAIGRSMFLDDQWGVVSAGQKWISIGSSEHVFDLVGDPLEQTDLNADGAVDTTPFHGVLSKALDRPVERILRVVGPGKNRSMSDRAIAFTLSHPSGVTKAWMRDHPLDDFSGPTIQDGVATMDKQPRKVMSRESFFQIGAGPDALEGLQLHTSRKEESKVATFSGAAPVYDGRAVTLLSSGGPTWPIEVTWSIKPFPSASSAIALDPEVTHELEALGYIEEVNEEASDE